MKQFQTRFPHRLHRAPDISPAPHNTTTHTENVRRQHLGPRQIGSCPTSPRARSEIAAYKRVNMGVPRNGAYDIVPKFRAACREPHTLSVSEGTTVQIIPYAAPVPMLKIHTPFNDVTPTAIHKNESKRIALESVTNTTRVTVLLGWKTNSPDECRSGKGDVKSAVGPVKRRENVLARLMTRT